MTLTDFSIWATTLLSLFSLPLSAAFAVPYAFPRSFSRHCTNLTIPISVSALQEQINNVPADLLNVTVLDQFLGVLLDPITGGSNSSGNSSTKYVRRSGTFEISARLCSPALGWNRSSQHHRGPDRGQTIQVLVHGLTYDKDYWEGNGSGERYSWASFASHQGYHTLAIDSLGNGLSSHPDPVQIVQNPLQVEILHHLSQKLRHEGLSNMTFRSIILVGHSYGSTTAARAAQAYPKDFSALVLTGFSEDTTAVIPAISPAAFYPASAVSPDRFSYLDQAYLTTSNEAGRTAAFYHKNGYDPAVAHHDFLSKGTAAMGELIPYNEPAASDYTGPVFVLTGDRDILYCGSAGVCLPKHNSTVAQTARFFPNAETFGFALARDSGHCVNLHYSARESFDVVHKWLAKQGF